MVLGLSLTDIEELYDVRFLIESFVQRRLADIDQEPLLSSLYRLIDKMELAVKHRDIADFSYLDLSFHEAMIGAAGHQRILHLWNSIRPVVMTVMLITTEEVFSKGDQKLDQVINKHRKIINALESKQPDIIQRDVEEYLRIRGLRFTGVSQSNRNCREQF